MNVSIIIPAYNEEKGILGTIDGVVEAIKPLGIEYELIVVNDGSTDKTAKIVENKNIKIINHEVNKGYGASIKTGIRCSQYENILIIDADGTYPAEKLPDLLGYMDSSDMVVGARTGENVHVPLIRRPAKWLLNRIANYLVDMKIPDLNSGFRVFRKKVAERYLHILPNGFSFTTTITLAMISDGYQVYYEPIDYYKREGRSKIKPVDALNFLIFIIRTITYFNPLRVFLPICLALFGLGMARLCYDVFWLHNLTDSTTLLFLFALQVGLIGIVADLIVKRSRP
jgi:glycosyltransferase involved in cell wall biosynthesis